MPDWISGLASLVAAVGALWAILQGRKKTNAETNSLLVHSYKALVVDLRAEYERKDAESELLEERCRVLRRERDALLDQAAHREAYLTIAQAKIAAYEGQDLSNSEAEND